MKRHLSAMSVVMLLSAIGCAPDAKAEEAFPNFDAREVVTGANRTWINYVAWWNKTQGTPLRGDTELDPGLWAPAIARINPAYVYTHGVNIVIVRSNRDGNEEGFYVSLTISSGPGANDEQFTRMLISHQAGGTVSTFQRRGHLERVQPAKSDETSTERPAGDTAARAATEKTGRPDPNSESAARSRIAARAAAESTPNPHSFGIFMPREDVLSSTRDVEERIRAYLQSKPGDIPLAKYPLISDRDIDSYDWRTHTLTVSRSVIRRVRPPLVWGTPFVVVADGEPIYVGAFYAVGSSQSCPVPVAMTRTDAIVIERAYPSATPDQLANDPRSDARIRNALQALGRLKE